MSNSGCENVYDYDGDEECFEHVFKDKYVYARKCYDCCECSHTILKGEKHHYLKAKHNGEFCYYRTCMDCDSVALSFFSVLRMYRCIWDDLDVHTSSSDGGISSECIGSLTKKAKDKVCDMIEYYWTTS